MYSPYAVSVSNYACVGSAICCLPPPPEILTAHGRELEERDGHAARVVQRSVHAEGRQRRHAALSHAEGGGHPHQERGGPERALSAGVQPRQGGDPHAQVRFFLFFFLRSNCQQPTVKRRKSVPSCAFQGELDVLPV